MAEITVQGQGSIRGMPDIATFYVRVETNGPTQQKAKQENNVLAQKVLAALKERIEEKDVRANPAQTHPQYKGHKVISYTATNSINVIVRNLDTLGELIQEVNNLAEGIQVEGLNYKIDMQNDLVNQARKLAFEDAVKNANLYATMAGIKELYVLKLSERLCHQQPTSDEVFCFAASAESVEAPEVVQPGENQIVVNVDVVFSGIAGTLQPLTSGV